MIPLQAVTPENLTEAIPGVSPGEARKIVGAVHRLDCLPESVSMVRRASLEAVRAAGRLLRLTVTAVHRSRLDPFIRYALASSDGSPIETVRIPLERPGRFSVCVSSQAGCALGCSYCATGRMGLLRNLEAWEIVEQVRVVRRDLDRGERQRVHGVVFQGMGEPLANLRNVFQAMRLLCEPCAQAIDGRTVTLCTAGIPIGIRRLAEEFPKVRLAVSIGSARTEVRRMLMPVDRVHPLATVLDAAADHAVRTGLAPMWALTLLSGVNDHPEDARALALRAQAFSRQTGLKPQIRLIPYNGINAAVQDGFQRSPATSESEFRRILREAGFNAHKRYSGGSDIQAGCGQLSAQTAPLNARE